ncbi:MAG: MaoC family dehydratase [Proteobacteria bacterium]|nr:MaoC family dehydratase [Pseudomonadota bacterium]
MSSVELTWENFKDYVGKEIGVSSWHVVDQQKINDFAKTTGDNQWVHVDVERANRESPFGGTIAHGYLTLSLVAALSMEIGIAPKDTIAAFNYGLDKVRFLTPVKSGSKVRLRVALADLTPKDQGVLMKNICTLEVEGAPRPAMVAETLAMLIPGRPFR